jgi:ASC-1-like (ASCH) protein
MNYKMKLNKSAFKGVANSKQRWETRLYDDKRKQIKVGDTINFYKLPELKESLSVKVVKIVTAKNFKELFNLFDTQEANWPANYSAKDCAESMKRFYTIDDQKKYGVVAFKIELI